MPPPPRPEPVQDAGAALARVALLSARLSERVLAPLTVAQYLALHAASSGAHVTAAELARAAAVSPAAVSQLAGSLEDAGLVRRERSADDRRRQAIVLTAEGRRTLRAADRRVAGPLDELIARLPPREAAALCRALPALADLLAGTPPPRRPGPGPGPRPGRRP